ncbi:MAG: GHKL domain-containing protein [candidate division Zixibacteria bacterium]|nr:GHKL domain-containing protein [candidate division Zixibacteria bacterium]
MLELRPRVCLICVLICAVFGGCQRAPEGPLVTSLEPVDDPSTLPYRFVVDQVRTPNDPTFVYPVDFEQDGNWESYQLQVGRHVTGELTSVLLYDCLFCGNVIAQHNFDNALFEHPSSTEADFDLDGNVDIAATYVLRDTVWLTVISQNSTALDPLYICHGTDSHRIDGLWDGKSTLVGSLDITGDQCPEIFVAVDTGYDLYPRKLVCVDWRAKQILWDFDVPANIPARLFSTIRNGSPDSALIVFSTFAKGNGAEANGMSDLRSYVIALNADGSERWRRSAGGLYTSAQSNVIDYDGDGHEEILFVAHADTATAEGRSAFNRGIRSSFVICNLAGKTLDSIPIPSRHEVRQLQLYPRGFGDGAVLTYILNDDTLRFVDQALNPLAKVSHPDGVALLSFGDFISSGSRQVILRLASSNLFLVDSQFTVLAQSDKPMDGAQVIPFPGSQSDKRSRVLISSNNKDNNFNIVFRMVRTPWYTIFSRKPWLASLLAFTPPALALVFVAVIMVQRKRKNDIIERQRDELSLALSELKDAQEKLVAAEKMQQARDIAGGVAHEIHNALYPAMASLDLLKRKLKKQSPRDDESLHELIDLSESAVVRANGMTELVREFTRLDADRTDDTIVLKDVINEIIRSLAQRVDETDTMINATIPAALCIRCRTEHAFILFNNLITNALDAVEGTLQRQINITATMTEDDAQIDVSDTGTGIPAADHDRIFNAFHSTKPSTGTGLGLTLARRIATVYGGSLQLVHSAENGTTFRVTLPMATDHQARDDDDH